MQFAIHKLGFLPENILVYGWSIGMYCTVKSITSFLKSFFTGGFTSSWLAMTYPDIRGLILDATFDHLEPLAIPRYSRWC